MEGTEAFKKFESYLKKKSEIIDPAIWARKEESFILGFDELSH